MLEELAASLSTTDKAGATRFEVLDAILGYLTRAAEGGPVLLVIEDLHWSTLTTQDAVHHLARRLSHVPILIVVTTRHARPDLPEPVALLLADLDRLPAVTTISLGGLSRPDVALLVAGLGGSGDADAIHAETNGNPLFVRELASSKSHGRAMSATAILVRRYAHLDPDDLALLDVASVIGTEFGADLLAAAAARPLGSCFESLERIETAGLVAALPGRLGYFAFSARSSGGSVSTRSPERVAYACTMPSPTCWREPMTVRRSRARPPCMYRLTTAKRPRGDGTRGVVPGLAAERALAPAEAGTHYERALAVSERLDPPDPTLRMDLAIRLGEMLLRSGDPRHRDVSRAAAAAAPRRWRRGQDRARGRRNGPVRPHDLGARERSQLVALAEEALSSLGPQRTPARARVPGGTRHRSPAPRPLLAPVHSSRTPMRSPSSSETPSHSGTSFARGASPATSPASRNRCRGRSRPHRDRPPNR